MTVVQPLNILKTVLNFQMFKIKSRTCLSRTVIHFNIDTKHNFPLFSELKVFKKTNFCLFVCSYQY